MKIVIAGGTGQLGTILARHYHSHGDTVVVLGRNPGITPWKSLKWNPEDSGSWMKELDGCDVVINLAGRSVNCRYNDENKREIIRSRIVSVQGVQRAIAAADHPPHTWLQASTATIYSHRFNEANDEATGHISMDTDMNDPGAADSWKFSIDVATQWEKALDDAVTPYTRKVKLRASIVLSTDKNGIFDTLLTLVKRGLGGTAASGRQYISWIHYIDFIRALDWIIDRPHLDDVINICSPNPLPNREFMSILRRANGTRLGLPATKWMLVIGAALMGTETEFVLKSRRVVPKRLLDDGFDFVYPHWKEAARELCGFDR